ncbi:hypothetical protein AAC387_Pa02g1871 [Persea americana]
MTVVEYFPPTRKPHSFDGAQHQTVVRPMPFGTQATTPTAKRTSVEPSLGRGSVVPEKNNPCRSHYQMMLRPSDSITAEISHVKGSSDEMSREKGPLCMSERKSSESSRAMARRALAQEAIAQKEPFQTRCQSICLTRRAKLEWTLFCKRVQNDTHPPKKRKHWGRPFRTNDQIIYADTDPETEPPTAEKSAADPARPKAEGYSEGTVSQEQNDTNTDARKGIL